MAEPSGYSYYKDIDVQDANIDGNLTNVCTLIQIVDDSDIGGNVVDDTNGHDIRFYDVTTDAILYYDRVYFDVTAGDCNATFYVKCPALYASVSDDQNNIRIYYGKAADSDGEDKANTWSDYVGVWHMADASGTVTDATGNHDSSSESISDYQAAGRVRYAMEFDGTNDGVLVSDTAALDQDTFSLQTWLAWDTWGVPEYSFHRFSSNEGAGGTTEGFTCLAAGSDPNEYLDFNVYEDGSVGDARTDGFTDADTWYLFHGTVDAAGVVLGYADSVVDSNDHDFGGGLTVTSSAVLGIGCQGDGLGNNAFNGHMEEVRYRTSALSANHIKFEYNNMDSSVNADYELTWGAETGVGATYTIECTTGTYAVTGKTLNAYFNRKAICTTGTYAITGANLNPLYNRKISCTTGSYLVTGAQLEPVYNENVTITPAVFSLVMTFPVGVVGLGTANYGDQVHMFMSMSMN